MPDQDQTMLVLVDSPEATQGIRGVSDQLAPSTEEVTPASLNLLTPYTRESPTHSEMSQAVDQLFRAAALRDSRWLGMRRDLAPPTELLRDLLLATGRHASPTVPGFAVFLAEGDVPPIKRILAIVDRRDGAISGMLVDTAVTVAQRADATLDFLVIAAHGEDFSSTDRMDALAVNRERDLYAQAVERAETAGMQVNWIMAAGVTDTWTLVVNQLGQEDYGLIIDDLGDVSLGGALRRGASLEKVLGPRRMGEVPLRLLSEYFNPLLLVIDGIQLGLAPSSLLKAGAAAALAMGVVSTGLTTGFAPSVSALTKGSGKAGAADKVMEELSDALSADEEDRAERASGASRSGAARERAVKAKAKKAPKAPKGGADAGDVARARQALQESKRDYEKAKSKLKRVRAELKEARADEESARARAVAALAELEAAKANLMEQRAQAADAREAASGLAGLLPGGTTDTEAQLAEAHADIARIRLDAAMEQGERAIDLLEDSGDDLAKAERVKEKVADRKDDAKAEASFDAAKLAVYRESLSESRTSPVRKGQYRISARFGQSGGYWSSGYHTGLDFAAPSGTDTFAAASGRVVSAGWAGAYGNRIVIDIGGGYELTYNHLSRIGVRVGQHVQTGDHIGDVGSTGNSTGAHLHFEVTKDGRFIDPAAWLNV